MLTLQLFNFLGFILDLRLSEFRLFATMLQYDAIGAYETE